MASGGTRELPEHGTEARYMRGDRCSECKSARTAAQRRRREARKRADDDSTNPGSARVTPFGALQRTVTNALETVELDAWGEAHAELALALARLVDAGEADAGHVQQLRDVLGDLESMAAPQARRQTGGGAVIIDSRGLADQ